MIHAINRKAKQFLITVFVMIAFVINCVGINADTYKYKISISERRIEYEHLGTEIRYDYTCNGYLIKNNSTFETSDEDLKILITITENDSIPDVGTGTLYFKNNGVAQENTIQIRVNENGGKRYAGAYAIFEITVKIEPINQTVKNTIKKDDKKENNKKTDSDYLHVDTNNYTNNIYKKEKNEIFTFENLVIGVIVLIVFKKIKTKKISVISSTQKNTIQNKNNKIDKNAANKKGDDDITCPNCGATMILRKGKYGYFYGCSNYPYCRGTRSYSDNNHYDLPSTNLEIKQKRIDSIVLEDSAERNNVIDVETKIVNSTDLSNAKKEDKTLQAINNRRNYSDTVKNNNKIKEKILYCRKCGTKVSEDSNFCHFCGKNIR